MDWAARERALVVVLLITIEEGALNVRVIGAGAMGGSFAALVHRAGSAVHVIDQSAKHVAAIQTRLVGVPAAYNAALVALLKGVETCRIREAAGAQIDYAAWEVRASSEPLPDAYKRNE